MQPDDAHQPLLAILGPTAVGKTALSLALAARLDGEIVSVDSRLVYIGMDIGTAKPTAAEQEIIPHHLIDILKPDQSLTVAEFQQRAYQAINAVQNRGLLPILVGGTGQYAAAILEGWSIPAAPPDTAIRTALEAFAAQYGAEALHARLQSADPVAAAAIDFRNVRRVVRALEVHQTTGLPISELQRRNPPPYRILKLGLTMPRTELYARIDARIDAMVEHGLVAEVERLIRAGYGWELSAMSALGYREFRDYMTGHASLEEAVALIKKDTRAFVRKQYNWFRLSDPSIHWLDPQALDLQKVEVSVRTWREGGSYG